MLYLIPLNKREIEKTELNKFNLVSVLEQVQVPTPVFLDRQLHLKCIFKNKHACKPTHSNKMERILP
jgi:hypothetical protein